MNNDIKSIKLFLPCGWLPYCDDGKVQPAEIK